MLHNYLKTALEMAQAGGGVLKRFWGKLEQIDSKAESIDLVTEADRIAEKTLLALVQKHYPTHQFLGEESGAWGETSEYLWVVDPLDGTTNYTHQYPMVCLSIALVVKGEPKVGVVYNPILNELFHATEGSGSYLNGNPIHVSSIATLERSLLASGFPYDRRSNPQNNYAEFCRLTHLTQGVRRGGSAALDLAYVAAGRFEGYWERGIKPWDVAAGILLVREAGGHALSYREALSGYMQASNGLIEQELEKELALARQHSFLILT